MGWFIVIAIVCVFVGALSSANKKTEATNYKLSNQGSRSTERQEWKYWSRTLLSEYNSLTGQQIPMPILHTKPEGTFGYTISDAYYKAFSGGWQGHAVSPERLQQIKTKVERHIRRLKSNPSAEIKDFNDSQLREYVISTLISPREEAVLRSSPFRDRDALEMLRKRYSLPTAAQLTSHRGLETKYETLYDVIYQCVRRSVHNIGYRYGGTDWNALNKEHSEWQDLKGEHPYLTNDPTFKGDDKK